MSKSIGNVVDPLAIIRDNGADILRLWVASTDYFEDVRIGKEVLAGTSDAYRKLRNTFRYLLGALDGFSEAEKVAPADMPELERWVLHRLAELDAELKEAAEGYEFNRYARALMAFANDDLSAFFFDIRKDSLYCDAPGDPKRRAYRTVLDTTFHALVRWLTPILCFTTEEVWGTRFPGHGSVHLLEWPEIDAGWLDQALGRKWERLREIRLFITGNVEPWRRDKTIGSSLEAEITLGLPTAADREIIASVPFEEICIVSSVSISPKDWQLDSVTVEVTKRNKCGRCWRHLPEVAEDGDLCGRCEGVVNG
jgi:isoleucyl-tRNA synthetase